MSKVRLGTALGQTGLARVLEPAHRALRTPIVVLAYHRVQPLPDAAQFPYDMGLLSATPEEFDWQMSVVRRDFDPIALSDVGLYLRGRFKLPKRPVVVTFDDGYRDNHDYAFPILRKHGIRATVFVATGHIGTTRQPIWHDLGACIAISAREGELPGVQGPVMLRPDDTMAQRRQVAKRFLTYLKTLQHRDMRALLQRLSAEHAGVLDRLDHAGVAMLDWDHVRAMAAGGVEFGSHTVTHAILSKLDSSELRDEVGRSKAQLEQELQCPCDTIAYPVGRRFAYTDEALAEVGLAGYRLGIAYDAGVNWAGGIDLFALRRQSVELDTTRAYFRTMLSLPSWFH